VRGTAEVIRRWCAIRPLSGHPGTPSSLRGVTIGRVSDATARPATPPPAPPDAAPDAPGAGTLALVVGVMGLVSAWTGWGGIVLGVVAVVAALVGLARIGAGRAQGKGRPGVGLALGLVAVAIGIALEWTTLSGAVTYLHTSQVRTLDECMRQAVNEKEQHVCKSQHLDEYRARYPDRLDP